LVLVSLLVAARTASAGTKEDGDRDAAREAAKQATAAFNLGHYAEAAALYEQAYKLVPDPILLYDLGQCHRLGNKPDEALVAYRSYLRTSAEDAPNREKVKQMVDELEWTLAASHKNEPAPAQVPAVAPPAARTDLSSQPPVAVEPPRASWKAWAPWAGVGLTAALGVAAIVEGLSVDSTFSNLQGTCGKTRSCTDSQLSSDRTKATVTNVLWGLTAASAAATGVVFYLSYSGGKGAGLSLAWRY